MKTDGNISWKKTTFQEHNQEKTKYHVTFWYQHHLTWWNSDAINCYKLNSKTKCVGKSITEKATRFATKHNNVVYSLPPTSHYT